jgi:hypothetical protein
MSLLPFEIKANDLPESQGYDLLPEGWYQARIESAELKKTRDLSGEFISIKYCILGPSFQGRKIFGNINITNKSAKAEEIGRAALGDIMRAGGVAALRDTNQLCGIALQIKISAKPADGQFEARNEVRGYKALDNSAPPPQPLVAQPTVSSPPTSSYAPPAQQPAQNAGGAMSTPPWMVKK